MSRDIKQLKPQKNSRYEQGYINPASCKKLFESQRGAPIIFRSSLEKRFVMWCESNKDVVHWGSECIQVPYMDPRDGSQHTYNPDFFLEMSNGDKIAVEIKPLQQTRKPNYPMRDDYQWNTYLKNKLKWMAAIKFFEAQGIKFTIITENFFKSIP